MAFAKPKYGNENKKSIKGLKEGTTRVRVLPPIHSGEKTGRWCVQHKQHFGFDTPRGEDPKSRNWNTFYCVEEFDFKTKTVTRACDECVDIKAQKELKDQTEKALKAKGKSEDEIKRTLEPISEYLKKHNLDNKHYINVKTPEGEFHTLKIPYKAKEKLFSLIEEYRNPQVPGRKAIDAIDAEQGLWFDFIRSGKGFNTTYDVKVVSEPVTVVIDGQETTVERIKLAPLTEADEEPAKASCYDLADVGIRRLPPEKVAMLVKATEYEEIDAIFASSERSPERSRERSAVTGPGTSNSAPAGAVNNTPPVERQEPRANTPADLGARQAPAVDVADEIEVLKARLAALTAPAKAETQAAAAEARHAEQAKTTVSPKTLVDAAAKVQDHKPAPTRAQVEDILSLPEDQFMSRFGPKK